MLNKFIMKKIDAGYRAEIIAAQFTYSGDLVVQNRKFKDYPKGQYIFGSFNVSAATGYRTLKNHTGLPYAVAMEHVAEWEEEGKKMPVYETTDHTTPLKGSDVITSHTYTAKLGEMVELPGDDIVVGRPAGGVTITGDDLHLKLDKEWLKTEEELKVLFKPKVVWSDGSSTELPDEVHIHQEKVSEPEPVASTATPEVKPDPLFGYFVSEEARLTFTTAHKMSLAKPDTAVKLIMGGPSGYGKTSLPKVFADVTGRKFLRMNCATIRDPEEWFGYREAREGSTVFIRSQFARSIEAGNLVLVLDEFNRLEPWLHNTLIPLLDHDGFTTVHDEEFHIGPNVIVVATINTGYKYTGTFEMDEALYNRFQFVLEVGPLPQLEEAKVLQQRTGIEKSEADKITKMAGVLRQSEIVCSTRTTLLIAEMYLAGMDIRHAFESAVVRRIPVDNSGAGLRKQAIDLINVSLGVYRIESIEDDVFSPPGEVISIGSSNTKTTSIEMRAKGTDIISVKLITLLRQLNVVDVMGASYRLAFSEAQRISTTLIKGETVNLDLGSIPSKDFLKDLSRVGITGVVHVGGKR